MFKFNEAFYIAEPKEEEASYQGKCSNQSYNNIPTSFCVKVIKT